MPKLTDTQTMLLAHASQRDHGSLYPLPQALADTDRAGKAIAALIKRHLVEERETSDAAVISRIEGDGRHGVFITVAGLTAIGAIETGASSDVTPPAPAAAPEPASRVTKAGTVLGLLQRESGATLAELIEATGWLPHTARAALTGLRKKGHAIERSKRNDANCYHIGGIA